MVQVSLHPKQIIHDLGMDSMSIGHVDKLSERHGHIIWRVMIGEQVFILKWFPKTSAKVEIDSYLLLTELVVPTITLFGYTEQALLLEDLTQSEEWRLAVQEDMGKAEVGTAVAHWFQHFHNAGEAFLSNGDCPAFLTREIDALSPESIFSIGTAFDLSHMRVWRFAANNIELLNAAIKNMKTTLNYNDFYWTNLSLSRQHDVQMEAVIFDYHLLGIGMRYSDCRNVTSSLSGNAVESFWDAYGDIDPRECVLDSPLATLYSLHVASRRSNFPKWAKPCLDDVINGHLERAFAEAIEAAQF